MKNLFLLTVGGLLWASTAHAQFGIRVGGNYTAFQTKAGELSSSSTLKQAGFQAGAYYQIPLNEWLSFVPGIEYSKERLTLTQTNYTSTGQSNGVAGMNTRLRMSYLNIPILLRATLGPVYLEAGAQAGLLLAGQASGILIYQDATTGDFTINNLEYSPKSRYRDLDVGPCIGVGINLPAGLGLNIRAYQGLVSLSHASDATYNGKLYRQNVQASLTYQLFKHFKIVATEKP